MVYERFLTTKPKWVKTIQVFRLQIRAQTDEDDRRHHRQNNPSSKNPQNKYTHQNLLFDVKLLLRGFVEGIEISSLEKESVRNRARRHL